MRIIGIDENGLGPILGPLVVTAVAFDTDAYDAQRFWSLAGPDLPAADSKALFTGARRHGTAKEAARRWLTVLGARVEGPADLRNLYLPTPLPCDKQAPLRCRPAGEAPAFDTPAPGLSLGAWNRFDIARVRPAGLRIAHLCPGQYNEMLGTMTSNKLELDFRTMLALIALLAPPPSSEPVLALCGKIGSTRCYGPWFQTAGTPAAPVVESAQDSTYDTPLGTISFLRDGDAHHLPIAVASMIGKLVREEEMAALNAALSNKDAPVSGYRDTRTRAFIDDSAALRGQLGMPDRCFIRDR